MKILKNVKVISDASRTNPLSLQEGPYIGVSISIDGEVKIYKNVHMPEKYLSTMKEASLAFVIKKSDLK